MRRRLVVCGGVRVTMSKCGRATSLCACFLSGSVRVRVGEGHPMIIVYPKNKCTVASSERTRPVTVRCLMEKCRTIVLHCDMRPTECPLTLLRLTGSITFLEGGTTRFRVSVGGVILRNFSTNNRLTTDLNIF